jgi:DNA-binding MarR family transcriptional regulator
MSSQLSADDRRRMTLEVTERGQAASAAVLSAVPEVDQELARAITPEQDAGLRAGLAALTSIRHREANEASPR